MRELLLRNDRRELESKHIENNGLLTQYDDGQDDVKDTKYAAKARQKANEILTLMGTMPFHQVADYTMPPIPLDGETAFHTTVHTEICVVCKQKDLRLVYCNTCDDLGGLYHMGCLTSLDTGKRVCAECLQKHQNTKEAMTITGAKEKETEASKPQKKEEVETVLTRENKRSMEPDARTSLSSEDSSQTLTATKSLTNSPLRQYTPRQQRTIGKGKLPSLTITHGKQTNQTIEISPLKTRGQQKQKRKEDAFDSSEDEDLDT